MNVRLPGPNFAANRHVMCRRLFSLLTLIALLVGTFILPTIAHAQEFAHGHNVEQPDHHTTADNSVPDDSDGDDQHHAIPHHHCNAALTADAGSLAFALMGASQNEFSLGATALTSFSQAPPTQPPSA